MKIIKSSKKKTNAKNWKKSIPCMNCMAVLEVEMKDIYKKETKIGTETVGTSYKIKCPCCEEETMVMSTDIPFLNKVQTYPSWLKHQMDITIAKLYALDSKNWKQRRTELPKTEMIAKSLQRLGI